MKFKRWIIIFLITVPMRVMALSAMSAAGAGLAIGGAIGLLAGTPAIVGAVVVAAGLHALVIGIAFDDSSSATPQGVPMPVNPGGNPSGTAGSDVGGGGIVIDLSPEPDAGPRMDGMLRNPTTPVGYFQFSNSRFGISLSKKFPDQKSAQEAAVKMYMNFQNSPEEVASRESYGIYDLSIRYLGDNELLECSSNGCAITYLTDLFSFTNKSDGCPDGYIQSNATTCTISKDSNQPKFYKASSGSFAANPSSSMPSNATISADGNTITAGTSDNGTVIHHNSDGTDTIVNVVSTSTSGGKAATVYTVDSTGVVIDSGVVGNDIGMSDLTSSNSGVSNSGSVGTGTGSGFSSSGSGTGTGTSGTGTGTGTSGTGTGTGEGEGDGNCGSTSNPCNVNFGGVGDAPGFGDDGKGSFSTGTLDGLVKGSGAFADLLSWKMPVNSAVCPKPTFEIFGSTVTMDSHCALLENNADTFRAVFRIIYILVALFIVLSA